ncbi:hypothetical protein P4O66_021231 [Electrophorus voltai]|uniref:Uncharacterized protein n=1 Tax=Electrophorus voltai TaxID=2609070 RepID=A0AAD8ZPT5_9TELE|nr:hypothetical protein P4O66_021231 [Electrophorus voltai]
MQAGQVLMWSVFQRCLVRVSQTVCVLAVAITLPLVRVTDIMSDCSENLTMCACSDFVHILKEELTATETRVEGADLGWGRADMQGTTPMHPGTHKLLRLDSKDGCTFCKLTGTRNEGVFRKNPCLLQGPRHDIVLPPASSSPVLASAPLTGVSRVDSEQAFITLMARRRLRLARKTLW